MDPVVKALVCPGCQKTVNVRVVPSADKHTFNCPGCKQIVTAAS